MHVSFEAGSRITAIDWEAFCDCTSLQSITLPDTLRDIGDNCFSGCTSLTSIAIPEGVTRLGSSTWHGVFADCTSLKSVQLPSTLTHLGQGCFRNCTSLQQISLPDTVVSVDSSTFAGSGLTSISLPEGLTKLSYHMFEGCTSLKTVHMSSNVTIIDSGAFMGCTSLESVQLPVDLTNLESSCFRRCTSLKELKFGDAVKYMGDNIFLDCPNLTVYVVRGTEVEEYCMNTDTRFEIYASSLGGCSIEGIEDKVYTGSQQTQKLQVNYGSDVLTEGTDYTVTYSNNVNAGTATLEVKGIGNYIGKVTKTFRIAAADMADCKLKLSKKSLAYQAKYLTPSVKVTFGGKTVGIGNYSVSYSYNQYVGTASVTVSGRENFHGTKSTTFTIVPKAIKIKKLKAASRGFKITWKKNTIQTTGYQIQYSLKKNFSGSKKVTIANNRTTSRSISKLKAGKTYYVRIRCYHTVSGKKYYSAWSKAKTVKTK